MSHIDDRIADLLLGDVSDGERESLEAHVAGCPRCNQELMQAADAFADLALALPAEAPPPALRARILDEVKPPRLAAMIDKLASLFDVPRAKARALLDAIDDPASWVDGPVPDSWVLMADGTGPKVAGAFCGFVKMAADRQVARAPPPRSRIHARPRRRVQAGRRRRGPSGDLHVMEEGSAHRFTIFDDEPCIAAAVVFGGVAFDDPGIKLGDISK